MTYSTNFKTSKDITSLFEINAPANRKNTIPVYEFERLRELDLNWAKITGQEGEEISLLSDIKEFFEDNWAKTLGIDGKTEQERTTFFNELKFFEIKGKVWGIEKLHVANISPEKARKSFCLNCFATQGANSICRKYILVDDFNEILNEDIFNALNFSEETSYAEAWEKLAKTGFTALAIGYEEDKDYGSFNVEYINDEGTASSITSYEYIKNATNADYASGASYKGQSKVEHVQREFLFYREEFFRLDAQRKFAQKVLDGSIKYLDAEFFGESLKNFSELWNDNEFLDLNAQKATNIEIKLVEIDEKVRQLVEMVKNLGYVLITKTEIIKRPPIPEQKVTAGDIFKLSPKTHSWTIIHTTRVRYARRKCGRTKYYWRTVRRQQYNTISYNLYEKISLDNRDYVESTIFKHKNEGKKVYVCKSTEAGFVTENGIPVREILEKCQNNDKFRFRCVIVIPEYDEILSDKKYYKGAHFYENPLPGIIPIRYPSVGFKEELSYKLNWEKIELGQLVNSINLAPGEARSITTSSKFVTTSTETSSFKSISEVSKSNSYDLVSEFQKEASREFQRTKSSRVSASASGSYGPLSGSASGSSSSSSSLKTFARRMSKIAKQTTSKINRNSKQEITSSSSRSTDISEISNRTITVNNTNQGSTLNLLFYRLNNVFEGSIYVNNIDVFVNASKELIAGSGIFDSRWSNLDNLDYIIDLLDPDQIPGKVNSKPNKYYNQLFKELFKGLVDEYSDHHNDGNSVRVIRFPKPQQIKGSARRIGLNDENSNFADNQQESLSELEKYLFNPFQNGDQKIAFAKDVIDTMELDFDKPINTTTLVINSGALYLESLVGIMPATERYSESMRELEAIRVQTEINKEQSLIDEIKLRNRILQQSENNFMSEFFVYPIGNDSHNIQITTFKKVEDSNTENWKLFIGSTEIDNPTIVISNNVITIKMPGTASNVTLYEQQLFMVNKVSGAILKKH